MSWGQGLTGTYLSDLFGGDSAPAEEAAESSTADKMKKDGLTDIQNAALREIDGCLRVSHETQELAVATALQIEMQGEQLGKIKASAEKVEGNLDLSEKLIQQIGSWGFAIKSVLGIEKSQQSSEKVSTAVEEFARLRPSAAPARERAASPGTDLWDSLAGKGDFEVKFDAGVDELLKSVKTTSEQASRMNGALQSQREVISDVSAVNDRSQKRISDQQRDMARFLGR